MTELPILIIDDEEHARVGLAATLEGLGFIEPICCDGLAAAQAALAQGAFALVLLDLHLTDGSGETLLEELSARRPDLPVIIATGMQDVATAVRCMRARAVDYLVKPVDPVALETALHRALKHSEMERENRAFSQLTQQMVPSHPEAFEEIITMDVEMSRLMLYAEIVAPGSQPVLITGETGTGKELMARAVHRLSRRPGRFVPVNVAGLDDTMISDVLFGHRRGSFTGAAGERAGLVSQAEDGTLFLDEIGDLPEASQVKLLRLLQEGDYYALGSDRPLHSTARIVAATNHDLATCRQEGRMRADLFYRLHAHHIHLPPLRDRSGDIPALIHHFTGQAARDLSLPVPPITPQAIQVLQAQAWPGNIRELAAAIHAAVARGRGASLMVDGFRAPPPPPQTENAFPEVLPTLDEMRNRLVAEALRRTGGNVAEASRLLGISRWGLSKRLKNTQDGAR